MLTPEGPPGIPWHSSTPDLSDRTESDADGGGDGHAKVA